MIQNKAYPEFYENQVLTHDHLNKLVSYLEGEDRESRIVDGSGIRCGLSVAYDKVAKVVSLSIGAGTTSKGYLVINRITRKFRYYQNFILPEGSEANYLEDADGNRLELYELLENDKDPEDPTVTNVNAKEIADKIDPGPGGIPIDLETNMAVILHLEITSVDLTTCKIDSCDNEGHENRLNWRALLIRKNDLEKLLKKDLGLSSTIQEYFRSKYKVHEVRIPRPIFNCKNSQSYKQIHLNYVYICRMAVEDLKMAFDKSEAAYKGYIGSSDMAFNRAALQSNLHYYTETSDARGIQYFYDHLKDVAMALNEFNNAAFVYHCECSLKQERYPNYLMAGSFMDALSQEYKDDIYRHYFEPCCKDLAGTNPKKELLNLYERVNAIIESFHHYFIEESKKIQQDRLFITAESRFSGSLGDLIPAYYYKNNKALRMRWSPDKFAHAQSRDIPCYWDRLNQDAATWIQDSYKSLRFRLDRHDCFHIEGHLGMSLSEFTAAFYRLKRNYGLPIDLKILEARATLKCAYDLPYANLKELKILFELEKKQIYCFLSTLFDRFKVFQTWLAHGTAAGYKMSGDKISKSSISGANMAKQESGETVNRIAGMIGPYNYDETIEKFNELILTETNPVIQAELSDLRASYEMAMYDLATDAEKEAFRFSTIEVIDGGESHTFIEDYNNRIAQGFFQMNRPDYLLNILAGLIHRTREYINNDDIESDSTFITNLVSSLKNNSKGIADLLDQTDRTILEGMNIRKCIILPLLTSIYGRCWANQFFSIKIKYKEVKESIESIMNEMTFSQYVYKHPGIEHIGGVPKGGTFIVVFRRETYNVEDQLEPFKAVNIPGNKDVYSQNLLDNYEKFAEKLGNIDLSSKKMVNEEIVADFSLPYLCCPDVSSIEYIVFMELKIDLPEAVCNNRERFKINYSPLGAALSGNNVMLDPNDGFYYFDPIGLEEGDYQITISLGTKSATYPLRVIQHPHAGYSVNPTNEQPAMQENGKYLWTFIAEEENRSYIWYRRNMSVGSEEFTEVTQEDLTNHYQQVSMAGIYELESGPDEVLDFELVLMVINGPCIDISTPVRYRFAPEVNWQIIPHALCNNIEEKALVYEPAGAELHGVGDLQDRVIKTQEGYIIKPKDLPEGSYEIEMSLEGYAPRMVEIQILQHPTAAFSKKTEEPALTGDMYKWVFLADEVILGYEYQWSFVHNGSSEDLPGETNPVYELTWDRYKGIHVHLRLTVTNRKGDALCEGSSTQEISYNAEEPNVVIDFPAEICSDIGTVPINYSPPEARLSGEPGSSYVIHETDNEASFNTDGLPEGTYPIYIHLGDYLGPSHQVTVLRTPRADYTKDSGYDDIRKQNFITFTAVEDNTDFTYKWLGADNKLLKEGREILFYWDPKEGFSLKLKLIVSNKGCVQESPIEEIFIPPPIYVSPDEVYERLPEWIYIRPEMVKTLPDWITIPLEIEIPQEGTYIDPEWIDIPVEGINIPADWNEKPPAWLNLPPGILIPPDGIQIMPREVPPVDIRIDPAGLDARLRESVAIGEEGPTALPAIFRDTITLIDKTNNEILESTSEIPGPEADPVERATSIAHIIDSSPTTERISSNLRNLDLMLDKLNEAEIPLEGKEATKEYIKSNLIAISEMLIARSNDLDTEIKTLEHINDITPKIEALYDISGSEAPKRELVLRGAGKESIKGFLSVIERI